MKVLLDENLPHQLRSELVGHEVFTVAYMGWSGIENGELLIKAADGGFDVLVTNDKGLEYEQNVAHLPLSVIVLVTKINTVEAIRKLLPSLHHVLRTINACQFVKLS